MTEKGKDRGVKQSTICFDIDRRLHRCIRQEAAVAGKTIREWATEALVEKLEDAIDAREGLAALNEPGESIPWEQAKAEWEARQGKHRETAATGQSARGATAK